MSTYNEKFDYVAAHLQWIRDHPNFESKEYSTCNISNLKINNLHFEKEPYIKVMTEWYINANSDFKNKLAYLNYKDDLRWIEESKKINLTLQKKDFQSNVSFVTVGFNHQEFTVKKALQFINSVLNSGKILDGTFAVIENFRHNGEHPHVHFKMYWSGQTYKSELIQAIQRSTHGKKLILKKEFIDIKEFIEGVHDKYLNGDKKEDKMICVQKDIDWRNKNKIPHKIYKDTKI